MSPVGATFEVHPALSQLTSRLASTWPPNDGISCSSLAPHTQANNCLPATVHFGDTVTAPGIVN